MVRTSQWSYSSQRDASGENVAEVVLLAEGADKITAWSCSTLVRLRGKGRGKHAGGAQRHGGGCGVAAATERWVKDLRSGVGELVFHDGSPVHGAASFFSN